MWIEEREVEEGRGGDGGRRGERDGENQKHKQVKSSLIMLFSSPPVPTARPNVGNMRILVGINFQIRKAESSKPRLEKPVCLFKKEENKASSCEISIVKFPPVDIVQQKVLARGYGK